MTTSIPPGVLRAEPMPSNDPQVAIYALRGDVIAGPIRKIEFARGAEPPPRRHFSPEHPFRLKILHFNDLHGHICHFTEHGQVPLFAKMVSRIKTLRRQARQREDMAVLVMSAGDDLVGSIFDELLDAEEAERIHVSYRLFSAAGVDAAALGNHDFDMGPASLTESIQRDARFPLLSANFASSHPLAEHILPASLFVVQAVRVGVIGLSTPGEINERWLSAFRLLNPVPVTHNLLPALRPLCDVVIILSHLGYSLSSHATTMRFAGDVELAQSLSRGGVQLIIGGHTHHILNEQGLSPANVVNDIPIVQAGNLGEFLGEVDITLRDAPAVTNARLTRTALLPADKSFQRHEIKPIEKLVTPVLARPLGRTVDDPDLDAACVRNDLAAGESAFANFIADALASRCRAHGHAVDLAFVDATSIRTGIPVGAALTLGDWFNVMPFADTIRLCWLTGRQLLNLVQDNARRIDLPGQPHIERGFLHFSHQMRYGIEMSQSRTQIRARDITFAGEPLKHHLDDIFAAACTSFVREPARAWQKAIEQTDRFPLFDLGRLSHLDTGLFLRRELVAYILKHGGVTAQAGARRDGRVALIRK